MKKYIGYIPAVFFTTYYLLKTAFGASLTWPIILVWLVCFWVSALLIHKGLLAGGVLGLFPGVHMTFVKEMYRGILLPGIKVPLGMVVLLFYVVVVFYLWKTKSANPSKVENREVGTLFVKMVLTVAAFLLSAYLAVVLWSFLIRLEILPGFAYISTLFPISVLLPMIWLKNRKRFMIRWLLAAGVYLLALGINLVC